MAFIRLPKFTRFVGIDYAGGVDTRYQFKGPASLLGGADIGAGWGAALTGPSQLLNPHRDQCRAVRHPVAASKSGEPKQCIYLSDPEL